MARPQRRRESAGTDDLARRLAAEVTGDVLFDRASRGRYATDASFYQIMPAGVVVPRTTDEALRTLSARARRRLHRDAARRRHLAMRPGRQQRHRRRLLETSEPHPVARRREGAPAWSSRASCSTISTGSCAGTACGFRSTSRPPRARPSAAWPATTPAAAARCATAPCATTPSRCARRWPTARCCISASSRATRRCSMSTRRGAICSATCSRSASARPARSPSAFRRCSGGSAATISTRWCPARGRTTWRICWSARKARSPSPPRSN